MAQVWSLLEDPWALERWQELFGYRPDLRRELALLDRVFPAPWRESSFATAPFKHRLPYHLATKGGWARLLDLAAELLLSVVPGEISPDVAVPMLGRLRHADLYSPTLCEIVVAPVMRAIGDVTWQPQGRGHGADFRIEHPSGVLVAEVKRVCTSRRQEQAIADPTATFMANMTPGQVLQVFTDAEELLNAREDARRLYPHVRYAASRIATSARIAANSRRKSGQSVARVPGVLLLDLDGNSSLRNLHPRITRWMQRSWARSIDLVLFVEYESCSNVWSTTVEPTFSRAHRAWRLLARTLRRCHQGHLHVRGRPPS